MTARVLALVLALLLVGGAAGRASAEAPAPDEIGAIADDPVIVGDATPSPPPAPRAIVVRAIGPELGAGRSAIDSIFRPPRTPAI